MEERTSFISRKVAQVIYREMAKIDTCIVTGRDTDSKIQYIHTCIRTYKHANALPVSLPVRLGATQEDGVGALRGQECELVKC